MNYRDQEQAHDRDNERRTFETLKQAAERTGMSTKTLRRRIAEGRLTAYRAGPRTIRLNPEDVDNLMVQIPTMLHVS